MTVECALALMEGQIRRLAGRYAKPGEWDDFIQVGRIGVWKAWQIVRPRTVDELFPLATTMAQRAMVDFLRTLIGRQGNRPVVVPFVDDMPHQAADPWPEVDDRISAGSDVARILSGATPREREACAHLLAGHNGTETAQLMSVAPARVSRIMRQLADRTSPDGRR